MRILNVCLSLLLLSIHLAIAPSYATAQESVLSVRVMGPIGPIPGANVTIQSGGRTVGSAATDDQGGMLVEAIPPGRYSIRVEAMGYLAGLKEDVALEAGKTTNLEFLLEVAPVELEGFSFEADRTRIERENMEFGTEVPKAAVRLLPVSREIKELVALTPGARPDHVWGGANAQANSYRVDGLSVNHPGVGSDLIQLSPQWIETVDVRGLGAGAEYGGFQGALVDITTKRGGERIEGSFRSTLEQDGLTGSNLMKSEIGQEVVGRLDTEGQLGGPLVADRLFFFLAGQRVRQVSNTLNHLPGVEGRYSPISEKQTEHRAFGKLTWTPNSETLLEVSSAFANTEASNTDLTGYEARGAGYLSRSPTWSVNAQARRLLGAWGSVELRANHLSSRESLYPENGNTLPGITHYSPTLPTPTYGNAPYVVEDAPATSSAALIGTFRVQAAGQEHSIKVGAEFTNGSFRNSRRRSGGMTWTPERTAEFDPADPTTWYAPGLGEIPTLWGGEVDLRADVANAAAFFQTSLSLGSRLVLTPGLRWNQWKGWITPTSGDRFQAVDATGWDPRVGASLDLTGSETFVLKAHWGRFHQGLISQMFDRAAGADVFSNEEFWYYSGPAPTNPELAFTRDERDALAAQGLFRKAGEVVLNETGTVQGYRQPFVDQWLIGFEKKIGSAAKFEVLYTRRSNHDMVALVDLNRDLNYTLFEDVTVLGKPFMGWGYSLDEFYVPNYVIRERLRCLSDGTCPEALPIPGLSAADTVGMVWNPQYVVTTAPDAKRDFDQIQFTLKLERPTWGSTLSYARSDLKGNLDNVSGYDDPAGEGPGPYVRVNEAVNSFGTLENFSDWEMKASVWGDLPFEIRGGLFWTFRGGDHYSPQFRLTSMGHVRLVVFEKSEADLGPQQGEELDFALLAPLEGQNIYKGPRGLPTLERQAIMDLRLERLFGFKGRELGVSLDVFNLLRCEAITRINTMINNGPDYWGHLVGSYDGVPSSERFQAPLERVRPQTVRLGVVTYF